ncbi:hypothetical protein ACFVR6_06275 [Microbacterium sp. NPDC058021]|uniref:hypothetical protein n=1 Tax=Microbacterium sp. NPDC058021 TaxID=3346306 RepID=UPI0036D9A1AE
MTEPRAHVVAVARDDARGFTQPVRESIRLGAGLGNPCRQIDGYRKGLMKELVHRDGEGRFVRLAGVMSVLTVGGVFRPGDPVVVTVPDGAVQPRQAV